MINKRNLVKLADIDKRTGAYLLNQGAIIEAIDNLLSVQIGSVPFNRGFGTRIPEYLFQPMDFITSKLIQSELTKAIRTYLTTKDIKMDSQIEVKMIPDQRIYKVSIIIVYQILDEAIYVNRDLRIKDGNEDQYSR